MGMMIIPAWQFQALVVIVIVLFFLLLALVMAVKTKMPEAPALLKASTLNRPVVQIHTALMQSKLFAPPREGKKKDGNMYKIEGLGVKFIPDPSGVEHLGTRRHIHFYSKAATGVNAKVAAACRDFDWVLQQHGLDSANETLVDSLLVASDAELIDRYPPLPVDESEELPADAFEDDNGVIYTMSEGYNTILSLRDELRAMVIRDGQFVFQTVQNYIFAVQAETARGLDEYCGIANERAVEAAGYMEKKDYTMTIFLFVFLLLGGAIAYKMLAS